MVKVAFSMLMLVGCSLLSFCPASAEELDAGDTDKQLHFLASYSINTTLLVVVPKDMPYRRLKAAGATLAIGLIKELTDEEFSEADMAANGLGVLMSTGLSYTFEF